MKHDSFREMAIETLAGIGALGLVACGLGVVMDAAERRELWIVYLAAACAPAMHELWRVKRDGFTLFWATLSLIAVFAINHYGDRDYLNNWYPRAVGCCVIIFIVLPRLFPPSDKPE